MILNLLSKESWVEIEERMSLKSINFGKTRVKLKQKLPTCSEHEGGDPDQIELFGKSEKD